jgi:hypothetical protein
MLHGISSTGHFWHAKHGIIMNAIDTNYLPLADKVMANILHLGKTMKDELHGPHLTALTGPAPPISTFVAAGRG